MKEKTSQALSDLVDRANKLKRYSLEKHIAEIGSGFRGHKSKDGNWAIEFDIPDEKELDASLLTLRLFTQQKEPFSFHKLEHLAWTNLITSSTTYTGRLI